MNGSASILIFGSAPQLIETRGLVLKHAGFDVTIESSLERTLELLARRPFDLFLLCHSLSVSDCEVALSQAHALRPGMKNLILCKPLSRRPKAERDTHLVAFASPENLIAAARDLTAGISLTT